MDAEKLKARKIYIVMGQGFRWVKHKGKVFVQYSPYSVLDRFIVEEINDFLDTYVVRYDDYNNEPTYLGHRYGMTEGRSSVE